MSNPSRYTTILIASLLALSAVTLWGISQRNEQAEMLLEQAQQKELVDGQLESAIAIYKDILARFPKNRVAGAKALVQMGQCYEKLGAAQSQEAQKAYERVERDFADSSSAGCRFSGICLRTRFPGSTSCSMILTPQPVNGFTLKAILQRIIILSPWGS